MHGQVLAGVFDELVSISFVREHKDVVGEVGGLFGDTRLNSTFRKGDRVGCLPQRPLPRKHIVVFDTFWYESLGQ